MIEISCHGGRIGRFSWQNSNFSGVFLRQGQVNTALIPGHCSWDHAWPDWHAWPVRPWGKGDAVDEHWRDFAAFEDWLPRQTKARNLDEHDFTINDKLEIYSMLVGVFNAGMEAAQNPWRWAQQLERRAAASSTTTEGS
jgi:hypothetical protein